MFHHFTWYWCKWNWSMISSQMSISFSFFFFFFFFWRLGQHSRFAILFESLVKTGTNCLIIKTFVILLASVNRFPLSFKRVTPILSSRWIHNNWRMASCCFGQDCLWSCCLHGSFSLTNVSLDFLWEISGYLPFATGFCFSVKSTFLFQLFGLIIINLWTCHFGKYIFSTVSNNMFPWNMSIKFRC